MMKTIIASIFGLLLALTITAQEGQETISSGDSPTMWLGGEVTFGSMSSRDFTFGPSFGLLFTDNIGAGTTVTFSSGNNSNAWGIEVYGRYYIPVVEKFAFYGDAFFGFGGEDNDTSNDGGEHNTLNFGARAGLQYWFTSQWSMAASSNVLIYNSRDGNGEFGAGVDFSAVNFSFFFHF